MLSLLLALGCGEPDPVDACEGGDELLVVLTELAYMRPNDDGTSPGFDLDGTDDDVCGIEDFDNELTGEPGVDNAFSTLIPALELTEAKAVEELINQTILDGNLLIILRVSGLHDADNDDCVDVELLRGMGEPLLGTNGGILDGQTIVLDPDAPSSEVEARIEDGVLRGIPFDLSLPVQVLDVMLQVQLYDGAVQLQQDEDGSYSGLFTGGVDSADLIGIATSTENIDPAVAESLEPLLAIAADLEPEGGECTRISIGFEFEAQPIYVFEEAAQ